MVEAKKVVEDNSLFTGEDFELDGVRDPHTEKMQALMFSVFPEIGWNPMEPNGVVGGMRGMMALMPRFFGEGTENWPLL